MSYIFKPHELATKVVIPPCSGGPNATIAKKSYADDDFKKVDIPQPATEELLVNVYGLIDFSSFRNLPKIFSTDMQHLKFDSQEQILWFTANRRDLLEAWGYGTIFYFEEIINGETKGFFAFFEYKDGHFTSHGYTPRLKLCDDINSWGTYIINYTRRIVAPARYLNHVKVL